MNQFIESLSMKNYLVSFYCNRLGPQKHSFRIKGLFRNRLECLVVLLNGAEFDYFALRVLFIRG